jgi:hypothetical protein
MLEAELHEALVPHVARPFHDARAGMPSCGVGFGPRPFRSKSILRCCGRITISTSVPSGTPGARNRPKAVSVSAP